MKIIKLRISDAWSFCTDHPAEITFDSRNTVIIGKNNSGKSNILRAILWAHRRILRNAVIEMGRSELYEYGQDDIQAKPEISLQVQLSQSEFHDFASQIPDNPNGPNKTDLQAKLTKEIKIHFRHDKTSSDKVTLIRELSPFSDEKEMHLKTGRDQEVIMRLGDWLHSCMISGVTLLGGWRSLQTPVEENKTVVKILHEMQGPSTNKPRHLRVFDKVETFFLKLTGLHSAQLRPTADGNGLNVWNRERYLPIQSFGDGVVHTLLMAFEFMRKRNHIFLVEEPETHLHPELIRMLMHEINADQNDNQFIITTHSPVLLDTSTQKLTYCVEYDGDFSSVSRCETQSDIRKVLDLLGVRLSDLLQANCVIWVEGPTDRMFIKRCLELEAPALIEGQHYQIAYYGGKLLAHYTADDKGGGLVDVLKLCRHSGIVVDSDADDPQAKLNDTKLRLKREIEESSGFFWITAGREVENYLSDRVIADTFKKILSNKTEPPPAFGQFDRLEAILQTWYPDPEHGDNWKIDYGSHKTRLMPLFVSHMTCDDLKHYDLKDQIDLLVRFVIAANTVKEPKKTTGKQGAPQYTETDKH